MSALVGMVGWDPGVRMGADHGGAGGSTPVAGLQSENDFRNLSAAEGLATLSGDFATDKPEFEEESFPGPIAEAAYWDDAAVLGIQGPVGSGKTTTLLKSRLRRARAMPRSVIDGVRRYKLLVVRATYRQLWSTTIPDFLKVFPKDLGSWSGGRGGPVEFTMDFEDEFGLIQFHVDFMAFGDDIVAALRGFQATDIWLHEMDTNPLDVLVNAITRIGRFPDQKHFVGYPAELRSYKQLVGDFNAPDEENWAFEFFHDEEKRAAIVADLNRAIEAAAKKAGETPVPIEINFYRQPGFGEAGTENLHNLGPGYYETQIATMKLAGRGDLIKRLVYNQTVFLRVGQPVFEREFSRQVHVSPTRLEPIKGLPLVIGLDQGFKGAAVIGQKVPLGGGKVQFRILAELMFPKERLFAAVFGGRLSDLLDERFPGFRVEGAWGDVAGEQGASQTDEDNRTWNLIVGRECGFKVRPQRVGANRIPPRLEAVRAPLELLVGGEPGILIDPRCTYLIAGFEARYVWTDEIDKNGDKRKVPNKQFVEANVMDALQYLCLSESLPDGTSRNSSQQKPHGRIGHNGGPPLAKHGGLKTDFNILNPYGD